MPDLSGFLRGNPGEHEPFEFPIGVEYPDGRVAGLDQVAGRVNDLLQGLVQIEPAPDRQRRLIKRLQGQGP
jgi:hypothetical protein